MIARRKWKNSEGMPEFIGLYVWKNRSTVCRMLKMAVQQGRSERRREAYPQGYVEGLSDARTTLADFFSILLGWLRDG